MQRHLRTTGLQATLRAKSRSRWCQTARANTSISPPVGLTTCSWPARYCRESAARPRHIALCIYYLWLTRKNCNDLMVSSYMRITVRTHGDEAMDLHSLD